MKPTSRRRLTLALVLPMVAVLAACGAATSDDDKASKSAPAANGSLDGPAAEPATSDFAGTGDEADNVAATAKSAIERSVIATGSLRLSTRHMDDVRQDAINVATGLGGHVADEQSRSDSHGRLDRVDLTLRVPSASFEKALDELGALGTVRNRQQSVEDVTTQVIDIDARVKAQAASVESIERLLARATTIAEIISIERQLSSRQAELDSLKQQQKWLADQTSLSTVQLTLVRPEDRKDEAHAGFLDGLESGWHALGKSAVAVGTAVGAVLPFAILVAVIGLPLWVVYRRRRVAAPAPLPEG
jgi:hypothetical protein